MLAIRCAVVSATLLACAASLHPQHLHPADSRPSFEVATIKPSPANAIGGGVDMRPDQFLARNRTLRDLILFAYFSTGSADQVIAGPAWLNTAHFDISAKGDAALAERMRSLPWDEQIVLIRSLVRRMLEDRFQLRVHPETRDLPAYTLVVVRSGSKLTSSTQPADGSSGIRLIGSHTIRADQVSLDRFAEQLDRFPEVQGRPVINRTRLAGIYDFTLRWSDDTLSAGATSGATAAADAPPLFIALPQQLGLALESAKAPVACIVIERAELPSPN